MRAELQVFYTEIKTEDVVTQVKVEIIEPNFNEDNTIEAYSVFGYVEGWTLSENNTKLTKIYSTNKIETVTVPIVATRFINGEVINFEESVYSHANVSITGIRTEDYLNVFTGYVKTETANAHIITDGKVYVSMLDTSGYLFSVANTGWTISEDKKQMEKIVSENNDYIENVIVYPLEEVDTDSTRANASISYSIDKIGYTIYAPIVSYADREVDGVTVGEDVSIVVPYTAGGKSGYAEISVDIVDDPLLKAGWELSDNNTKITKLYLDNTQETIPVTVVSIEGYWNPSSFNVVINVDGINYKKTVKGRCETTMCLYDVYTKSEMDNQNLKIEQKLEKVSNSGAVGECRTLTGEITVEASSQETLTINYPDGFTMDNSIPLAFGLKVIETTGYNYYGDYSNGATDLALGSFKRRINLTPNNILIKIFNPATSQSSTVNYKIVLMKVR